ncbi:hypothetical protein TBLA_0D01730 [Henningerozyma blattae CBS 6284]|uniref:Ribosomal RNA-processing protein 17 n=1 Tax=Henningerozyma blattae (strain ATCC 34711 / CBS 6284 / DSM 70876 / NBRC 10599 / NRRL Y-10934 / UCD 77-7) TaxID=1071380 RepID=I2H2S9_HENB6|nr:hypothetical protein TBLA_0D01730 [Tetrapisispora blattae CBS 6284]CCH60681.1 hypothetical protein TBLA_0D01730 [Tetrapisispora blattae CBS 6284]
MAVRSNRQILTQGQKYVSKQSKKFGTEELNFDKDSRLEYLTGFHMRKLLRQKKAQEFIKEQERLAKIEERKKVRQERREVFEKQLSDFKESLDIESTIKDQIEVDEEGFTKIHNAEEDDMEEEWTGFNSDSDSKEDEKDEVKPILKKNIIGEDTYDNDVTVEIESLEPNENFEYLARLNNVRLEKSEKVLDASITRAKKYAKFLGMANGEEEEEEDSNGVSKKKKKPKKKFRYLTKAERRSNQRKANNNKRRK